MLNSEPGYAKKRSNLIGHGDELDLWLVPRFTADLTHTPTPDKYFGWAAFSGSGFLIRGDPSSLFMANLDPGGLCKKIIETSLSNLSWSRCYVEEHIFVIIGTSLTPPTAYPRFPGLDAGVVWSGSVRTEQDQTDAASQGWNRRGGVIARTKKTNLFPRKMIFLATI